MVGSHLCDFLLENTDWEVHGLTRWRSPLANLAHLMPLVNAGRRVYLHEGDLLDQGSLNRVVSKVNPNFIFHLAAQSYPTASFASPVATLDTNILGTARLLEAIAAHGESPRVHVCSSSEVYGRVDRKHLPISEEAPFGPASPYSISKIGTDLLGQFWAEAYGVDVLVTRMFTHTGPRRGDVFAESSFAKQIALIEQDAIEPIIRVGNLNSLRTWSDVRDAVRAYYLLLTSDLPPGEVYNIGGDYSCTVGDMLKHLIGLSTRKDAIRVEVDPSRLRPLDADLQVPTTEKFRVATGWSPEIGFDTTMNDLLNYWRANVATQAVSSRR